MYAMRKKQLTFMVYHVFACTFALSGILVSAADIAASRLAYFVLNAARYGL